MLGLTTDKAKARTVVRNYGEKEEQPACRPEDGSKLYVTKCSLEDIS